MRIHFPMFLEWHGLLFHAKYVRKPYLRNICIFPYFSYTMGIHFSYVLEILWIFASREIFKKPIIFECLYFPILFPYNENSLFPCFGNCMDFCFTQNKWVTLDIGIFCFPIFFSYYRNSLSLSFWSNTTNVKTNKKFLFPVPILTQTFVWNFLLRKSTYFVAEPGPLSAFQIPFS